MIVAGKEQLNPEKATSETPTSDVGTGEQTPQDSYGNAFLAGMLGNAITDWGASWFGPSPEEQAIEEQREFLAKSWPALADFDTGTGGFFDGDLTGAN